MSVAIYVFSQKMGGCFALMANDINGYPIPLCPFYAPIKTVQYKYTTTGMQYTNVIQSTKEVIDRFCREFGIKGIKFEKIREGVILLFVDEVGKLFEKGFVLVHRSTTFFSNDKMPFISDLKYCLKLVDT